MSSSSASQCRPSRLILTCLRCFAVPRIKRGNHASGTPIVRPSVRSTHMQSESNLTRFALTEELIPCPLDPLTICQHNLQQLTESSSVVTIIVGQPNLRLQPEFRLRVTLLNVDVDLLTRRALV